MVVAGAELDAAGGAAAVLAVATGLTDAVTVDVAVASGGVTLGSVVEGPHAATKTSTSAERMSFSRARRSDI